MDAVLLSALQSFEAQYKQQILAFISTATTDVSAYSPQYTTGINYTTFVSDLNAVAGGTPVPASVATEIQNIQNVAIAGIINANQATINEKLTGLLSRTEKLCLSELIDLINSGLFTSQLNAAFAIASSEITSLVNAMLAQQMAVINGLGLTPAQLTIANTQLPANATTLQAFLAAQLTALQNQLINLYTALTTSLASLMTTGIKAFQNLAINQINSLVTAVFGTIGVPAQIPPVV